MKIRTPKATVKAFPRRHQAAHAANQRASATMIHGPNDPQHPKNTNKRPSSGHDDGGKRKATADDPKKHRVGCQLCCMTLSMTCSMLGMTVFTPPSGTVLPAVKGLDRKQNGHYACTKAHPRAPESTQDQLKSVQ